MFIYRLIPIVSFVLMGLGLFSQSRWTNNYLEGEDPFGECIIEHYDGGYLIGGRYGPNYPSFNWLIKTDINGEVLWRKDFGIETSFMVLTANLGNNYEEDIYLTGSTYYYGEDDADPLIMKLNSCGEKEWCKVFLEEDNNYSRAITVTEDGGVAMILVYMNDLPFIDRICLARFDIDGNLQWKYCYNSTDTALSNQDAWNLTLAPDDGFLISATCGYKDPEPPHATYAKPYYIKTDSLGNLEWEKVVYSEVSKKGGEAWSTVLSPDSNFYYSSISHYYRSTPYGNSPALLKMDMEGNVVDIYDIASPSTYGKLFEAKFNSDSTLMASVAMGNGSPKAVVVDTLGNIIHQANLLDNEWMALTEVTFDNKLLFLTNIHDEDDNFDTYLFKLNPQLQSDTLYSQWYNYDSLCPYQITSDTIPIEGCGLIVGDREVKAEVEIESLFKVFPNPAKDYFVIENLFPQSNQKIVVSITDMQFREIERIEINSHETETRISTINYGAGVYLIRFYVYSQLKQSEIISIIK